LVANRGQEGYCRVTIDIGNYRERREETLSGMARRHAIRAAKTGRKTSLEPMNPYERRIIHTAVQKVEGATSWSVGKEPSRHVIIGPSDDNPMKNHPQGGRDDRRKGGRSDRRGGQRSGESAAKREKRSDPYTITYKPREVRAFVSRQNPMKAADGATPPEKTFSTVENSDVKLYGRIDL
jgi:spoIIIJ-associated protein